MRVLVTWGSKRGGTEGIAHIICETLRAKGFEVDELPWRSAAAATGFDAVIVGGALYAGRWHPGARWFVAHRQQDLQKVPVWFFSSGPLDNSSDRDEIPPTLQVEVFMERVGAIGHATFGGRLPADARGFPASAMARKHAGDWRNEARIRAWATALSGYLPSARPGQVVHQPGGSIARLVAYATLGWSACTAAMFAQLKVSNARVALSIHAIVVPVIFTAIAHFYFRARGARGTVATALVFVTTVAFLDLFVVAGVVQHSATMFVSVVGLWIPLALIFLVTWAAGEWRWIAPKSRKDMGHGVTVAADQ
jgi:menaquinone-dependent protoporphyrinogen oxidase